MPGLVTGEIFKIALPWAMGALGFTKLLRERWLRCPQEHLADAIDNANQILTLKDPNAPLLTEAQWRAVEATQAQILGAGIIARIVPQ